MTTSDGYILRLHRISHGRSLSKASKGVVFLMHGLLSSSADWILTGPNNGLGYILADEGYDVWMGNARGNSESRRHITLNPDKDSSFWQFSWHEIGAIDLPTMIDYVLSETKEKSLIHIGHSQGTTTFYVMTSKLPEYNAKIKAHFSLAPIAYMNHMTSPLMKILAFWSTGLDILLKLIGVNEFLPSSDFLGLAGGALCGDDAITQFLCTNALFAICGFSQAQMNATILPVIVGHTPAGSSVKQFMHYAQEIKSGAFRHYDFGLSNLGKYGSLTPPPYDLNAITTPIYLIYSHNDWLAAEKDVLRLCEGLGASCQGKFLVADSGFNHLDYMYGIGAPSLVYDKLIGLMTRYQ